MSLPQQYRLTAAEFDQLIELVSRQDGQGVKNFFDAMPKAKSDAVAKQILLGVLPTVAERNPMAAIRIMNVLQQNS